MPRSFGKKQNEPQYEFPGVGEDELTELKEAFDLFDKDAGGTVDGKELKGMYVFMKCLSHSQQVSFIVLLSLAVCVVYMRGRINFFLYYMTI